MLRRGASPALARVLSPPPAYQNAPWRILDADTAYAALAPIYLAPNP